MLLILSLASCLRCSIYSIMRTAAPPHDTQNAVPVKKEAPDLPVRTVPVGAAGFYSTVKWPVLRPFLAATFSSKQYGILATGTAVPLELLLASTSRQHMLHVPLLIVQHCDRLPVVIQRAPAIGHTL